MMKEITEKTERDYIDIIGRTAFATRNYREKRWNQYYFAANVRAVRSLLKAESDREKILDVGCSHGSWYKIWKDLEFNRIHGVEMSEKRADEARATGFDKVYNCSAHSIPAESGSYQIACSSDMFIHVLQLKDKLAIMLEIYRILKPGGCFIFNFAPPHPHGYDKDRVEKHCSLYTLDTMIREVVVKTGFIIEDMKTTYYPKYSLVRKVLGYGIIFPLGVSLLKLHDFLFSGYLPVQQSLNVYLKLRKALP